jgi:hypothetical protein
VSYLGFAVSGWLVSRFGRPTGLLTYTISVSAVITGTETIIEYLNRPFGVPYKFIIYVLTPSRPYLCRSGLLLIPFAVLVGGVAASRKTRRPV